MKQLLQMQQKYKFIKPGSSVLDLGCAPGAWLQVHPILILSFSFLKLIFSWRLFDGYHCIVFLGFGFATLAKYWYHKTEIEIKQMYQESED